MQDSSSEDEQPTRSLPVTVVLAVLNSFFLGLLLLLVYTVLEDRPGGTLLAINCWICIFGASMIFLRFRTIWFGAVAYFGFLFLTFASLVLASLLSVVTETWAVLTLPALLCGISLVLLAYPSSRRYYGFPMG